MTGKILVVDDVATNRLLLNLLLSKAFYEVEEAANGPQALEMALRNPPDLALIDVMMPGMNGFELCRLMKTNPRLAHVPVVIITSLAAQEDRVAALESGADEFLTKPVRELALHARLRSLLRMKAITDELRMRDETLRDLAVGATPPLLTEPPPGARVLAVSSEANGAHILEMIQPTLDIRPTLVTTARAAFDAIARDAPQAVLIDALGFAEFSSTFCTALRQRPESRAAAMLTLVDSGDIATAAACLDAGANDYAMWPLHASELTARLRTQLRQKAHTDQLRASLDDGLRQAVTDPLTGLRNRRYLDAHLIRMIAKAQEQAEPLCLMAFDLDSFKAINDTYGHGAGDMILKDFARRLSENTRAVDLVARIGGEEFVVAMPAAGLTDAIEAAERVRAAVEKPGFLVGDFLIDVTVSVGVSELRRGEDCASALLKRADAALYVAKAEGRNRVSLAAA